MKINIKNHTKKLIGVSGPARSQAALDETRSTRLVGESQNNKTSPSYKLFTWLLVGLVLAVFPFGHVFASAPDKATNLPVSLDLPLPTPPLEGQPALEIQNVSSGQVVSGPSHPAVYLPVINTQDTPISQISAVQSIFYVSLNGNDANPGSQSQPWKTIQKAANTLSAGQTVKILPGTYNAKFTPLNSGTASAYITYTADPGTVILDGSNLSLSNDAKGDGLVQIQGKSYLKIQNLSLRNSTANCVNISDNTSGTRSNHIEVTGLAVQNCTKVGIRTRSSDHILIKNNTINHISYSSGIGVWWNSYATVDHNTITNAHYYHECQGAYDEALTISGTNHFEVKNNFLDNTEPNPAGFCSNADKLGIDIKESSQNGSVYANTVQHMTTSSIYVDGWHAGANGSATLNHIDLHKNITINGGGITIACEQADGVVEHINIYNNLVLNTSFAGIQVRGAYGDGLRKNIKIYNNTVYGALPAGGNGGAGIYITTANLKSNNSDAPVIIRNNIVMFNFPSGNAWSGQIVAANSTIASKIAADHNLVYGPLHCSGTYPGCLEVGSRTAVTPAGAFVNPTSLDLHLKSGSPAINSGASVSFITTDYDSAPRPQPVGTAIDIGAYEYQ